MTETTKYVNEWVGANDKRPDYLKSKSTRDDVVLILDSYAECLESEYQERLARAMQRIRDKCVKQVASADGELYLKGMDNERVVCKAQAISRIMQNVSID